jgi:hypothetical protein
LSRSQVSRLVETKLPLPPTAAPIPWRLASCGGALFTTGKDNALPGRFVCEGGYDSLKTAETGPRFNACQEHEHGEEMPPRYRFDSRFDAGRGLNNQYHHRHLPVARICTSQVLAQTSPL